MQINRYKYTNTQIQFGSNLKIDLTLDSGKIRQTVKESQPLILITVSKQIKDQLQRFFSKKNINF